MLYYLLVFLHKWLLQKLMNLNVHQVLDAILGVERDEVQFWTVNVVRQIGAISESQCLRVW